MAVSNRRVIKSVLAPVLVLGISVGGGAISTPLKDHFDLPPNQHPESVAFDRVERAFYAGSLLGGGIVRIDGVSGEVSQFKAAAELPFAAITGLRIDPERRQLWACNVEPAAVVAFQAGGLPSEPVQSGLALIDLESANLKIWLPFAAALGIGAPGYFCNDVAIDADGYVYATESIGGRVVQASPDGLHFRRVVADERLERAAGSQDSLGVNGIAWSPRDKNIYLSNDSTGRMLRFPAVDAVTVPLLAEVHLSEPVHGDGFIIDPRNGKGYLVHGKGAERAVKVVNLHAAARVNNVSTIPWPALPRPFDTPTAGDYAEGRFYIADAGFSTLQDPLDDTPGLVLSIDLD